MKLYYEYEVDLRPGKLAVGQKYIVDKVTVPSKNAPGGVVTWYQFRIPIREPSGKVGSINGFKSMRFMRMYMTDFGRACCTSFCRIANGSQPVS